MRPIRRVLPFLALLAFVLALLVLAYLRAPDPPDPTVAVTPARGPSYGPDGKGAAWLGDPGAAFIDDTGKLYVRCDDDDVVCSGVAP